jgi:hypothetical protein
MSHNGMWAGAAALLVSTIGFAAGIDLPATTDGLLESINPKLLAVTVGCPWVGGIDDEGQNTGFPDKAATYYTVTIPTRAAPGTEYRIEGRFLQARYFSLQSYDGFRAGNLIDSLPDALLHPDQGGEPAASPAVLPESGGYTYTYTARIKYQDKPAAADREPNTLYVGADTNTGAFLKNIVFRSYLMNPGVAEPALDDLPRVIYAGPNGEIDLQDTPDQTSCMLNGLGWKTLKVFPAGGLSDANLDFKPVTERDTTGFYHNADAYYLRAGPGRSYSDMVVVRLKSPRVPALPPLVVEDPDVRYWSLCQYMNFTTAVVDCVADRNATLDADGYANIVISPEAKRPPLARPEHGYDWLPWGDTTTAMVGLRQLLVRPDFAGSYGRFVADPDRPIEDVLGEWAPDITYCDSATFAATAPQGGAALMAACKSAYSPLLSPLGTTLGNSLGWLGAPPP